MKDICTCLKRVLDEKLAESGHSIFLHSEKEVAIIYSNDFTLESSSDEFPYQSKGSTKNAMLTCTFNYGNRRVRLGSFHAQFGLDYTELIETFGKDTLTKTDLTIIGGDANHPSNYQFPGLLTVSEKDVSNFFTNYYKVDPYTEVELHDHRNNSPKNYDGFLVFTTLDVETKVTGEHYWDKEVVDGREIPVLRTYTDASN